MKNLIAVLLMMFCASQAYAAPKHNKKEIAVLVGTFAFGAVATAMDAHTSQRSGLQMWAVTGGLDVASYVFWRKHSVLQTLPETFSTTLNAKHILAYENNTSKTVVKP